MILTSLLSSSSFIMTNKILIKSVGLDAAVLLSELCSEYNYWEQKGELYQNMWFFSTRENIEENTGLSEHKQRMAINILIKKDLIETKKMGIPCKIYYKLNEQNILKNYEETRKKCSEGAENSVVENLDNKTSKDSTSSNEKSEQQDVQKLNINNNNNYNNNKNNENHTHAETEETKNQFAKTVFMTQEEYNDLINQYGVDLSKRLIEQLDLYKQANRKSYNSDYAAILRWVTTRLREMEKEKQRYDNFKNKQKSNNYQYTNYEQREYSPEFLNSLVCNWNLENENMEVNESEK